MGYEPLLSASLSLPTPGGVSELADSGLLSQLVELIIRVFMGMHHHALPPITINIIIIEPPL
jgi:hypothetical protein